MLFALLLTLLAAPQNRDAWGKWKYQESVSRMDDSTTIVVSLDANEPVAGWPGSRKVPTLILRCRKESKEFSAYVVTGFASHRVPDYEPWAMLRFDRDPPVRHDVAESDTNDGLFFDDPRALLKLLLSRDAMLFGFIPFQSTKQETSFDLRGLNPTSAPLRVACGLE